MQVASPDAHQVLNRIPQNTIIIIIMKKEKKITYINTHPFGFGSTWLIFGEPFISLESAHGSAVGLCWNALFQAVIILILK